MTDLLFKWPSYVIKMWRSFKCLLNVFFCKSIMHNYFNSDGNLMSSGHIRWNAFELGLHTSISVAYSM